MVTNPVQGDAPYCRFYLQPQSSTPVSADQKCKMCSFEVGGCKIDSESLSGQRHFNFYFVIDDVIIRSAMS